MQLPFFKFYLRDWEGDAQLMSCSLAARGLLIHIIRVMKEAEPHGFFVGRNGEPIDLRQFCEHVHAKPREVRALILELEASGALSRDAHGRLFSRRLVREATRSEINSENGRRGGNPALKRSSDNQTSDNRNGLSGGLSGRITEPDKPQIPEARNTLSLRSSAIEFGRIPADLDGLRRLAMIFVGAFANCRDESKAEKHLPHYAGLLAQMRNRNVLVLEAWEACEQALEINGRPLFGASIKSAMSFLPPPGAPRRIQSLASPASEESPIVARLRAAQERGA